MLSVYPETRGVPLEEMDAVFGEGSCTHCHRVWGATLILML